MARPPKDIRMTARADRGGRYAVCYAEDPGHWHQSPEDGYTKAMAWAKRNRSRLVASADHALRLADLVRDIFVPGSPWRAAQEAKGHTFGDAYISNRDGHVRNYMIRLFGNDDPRQLTRKYVDDTLMAASRAGLFGKPLAPATMHKIVQTFNIVLEDLVDRGFIERNPILGMRQYSKSPVRPRGVIPTASLARMFPAGHGALVRVWGSSLWSACMCLFADTGMRPGELRALRWREIDDQRRFIPLRHGIVAGTTDNVGKGKTGGARAGFPSVRTMAELESWKAESRHAGPEDFVFTEDGEAPVTGAGIVAAFRRGLAYLGIEAPDWTPYWLRHSFVTLNLENLSELELSTIAGHSVAISRAHYQHPDDDILYAKNKPIQDKLDRARGE